MKQGKRYRAAIEQIHSRERHGDSSVNMKDAVEMIKQVASAKFDETVEIAIKLGIKKGVSVRNTVVLPHRFGGEQRILVFARGEKEQEAEESGASYVGNDDLIAKIKDGWLDFDVAVATPDMMREVGKLGPILGRRGLMPNPKTQTVGMDIRGIIGELKKGRVEFRSDKTGVVHLAVGKVSMPDEQLVENLQTVIEEVRQRRPTDFKGEFVKTIFISSTMGPSVRVV